jgi:hypothetical protein
MLGVQICWEFGFGRVLKFLAFVNGWKRLHMIRSYWKWVVQFGLRLFERGGLEAMLLKWELLR